MGIADASIGIETTFNTIIKLSQGCRFKDCTHINEGGCSVLEALEKGELDKTSYDNYLRMERERIHFESNVAERRKKDKDFGKMVKNFKRGIVHIDKIHLFSSESLNHRCFTK